MLQLRIAKRVPTTGFRNIQRETFDGTRWAATPSGLSAYAGQLFVGRHIHDLELLRVQRGVRAKQKPPEIAFFHFLNMLLVFSAQALQNRGVDCDAELEVRFVAGPFLEDLAELALDFNTHGQG